MQRLAPLFAAVLLAALPAAAQDAAPAATGVMVGEVTHNAALLQFDTVDAAALQALSADPYAALPTQSAHVRVRVTPRHDPTHAVHDDAHTTGDVPTRLLLTGLAPGTAYAYSLTLADGTDAPLAAGTFRTLPGPDASVPLTVAVTTCINYDFHFDPDKPGPALDQRADGYAALRSIAALDPAPALVVYNGDVVYYDKPPVATTAEAMRLKWRQQFALPSFRDALLQLPGYFTKDDHDHRYNDSDREGDRAPTNALGVALFREMVPAVPAGDDASPTYRTVRVSADLQLWFLEGRDYRSPNDAPDGPDKTLWGETQRDWLMQTLADSDAPLRVVVTPTPLVGPDDAYKRDNHTNPRGFRHEGEAFLDWLAEAGLTDRVTIVTGDRHWQYHSVSPQGVHEFAPGAIGDASARRGRAPGDPRSTDPDATVDQRFASPQPTGGFLVLEVTPAHGDAAAQLTIRLHDEHGEPLYEHTRAPG